MFFQDESSIDTQDLLSSCAGSKADAGELEADHVLPILTSTKHDEQHRRDPPESHSSLETLPLRSERKRKAPIDEIPCTGAWQAAKRASTLIASVTWRGAPRTVVLLMPAARQNDANDANDNDERRRRLAQSHIDADALDELTEDEEKEGLHDEQPSEDQ